MQPYSDQLEELHELDNTQILRPPNKQSEIIRLRAGEGFRHMQSGFLDEDYHVTDCGTHQRDAKVPGRSLCVGIDWFINGPASAVVH